MKKQNTVSFILRQGDYYIGAVRVLVRASWYTKQTRVYRRSPDLAMQDAKQMQANILV